MSFSEEYIVETNKILSNLDFEQIEKIAIGLNNTRNIGGRLFILGVGGSAGTASHAVNDFRKICKIETYTPIDNVSELTATTNDEGWENCFVNWLKTSHINHKDSILVLSVGGGNQEKNVSMNIVHAINYAKINGLSIYGITGKDGGYTKQNSSACLVIPPLISNRITPHTEGICSVILHLLVSHPVLKIAQTKWESIK